MQHQVEATPADTHVPENIAHRFCECQWPVNGPGVGQSLCGLTLPIEGRRATPSKPRCPECEKLKGVVWCPSCGNPLWLG
jgi:hypothetical protein